MCDETLSVHSLKESIWFYVTFDRECLCSTNYVPTVKICTGVTLEKLSGRKKLFPKVSLMWEGCEYRP